MIFSSGEASSVAQVSRVLSTTSELHRFIDDLSDSEIEFARLYMWADQLVTIPVLSRRLKEAIDEDGGRFRLTVHEQLVHCDECSVL